MAEEIPKQVKDYYDKAALAIERENYNYALDLLTQALALKPDFDECRYRMRLVAKKKLEVSPIPIIKKPFIKIKQIIPFIKGSILEKKGQNIEASLIYENILRHVPDNIFVLIRLGCSLQAAEMPEAAVKTFEEAFGQHPKNVAVLKNLARLCMTTENYGEAQAYYEYASRIAPEDEEVKQRLKDIDALASIKKGHWEDLETYRTKIKDIEEAQVLETADKVIRTESDIEILIKDNLEKLKTDPANHVILRTLGDLYGRKHEFDTAADYYKKVIELDPQNYAIKRRLGEMQIKKAEDQLQEKEKQLRQEPDNQTLKDEVQKLKSRLEELKLEHLADSVALYPNDLNLRYQYGFMLFSSGMIDKAIGEFQLSVNDPVRRNSSLNMLGLCFKEKKMFDLALTQFQKAMEKLAALDAQKKDVLYNLGATYDEMGRFKEALEEYKKIYEVDINFRDIATKVDQAYKKQQGDSKPRTNLVRDK